MQFLQDHPFNTLKKSFSRRIDRNKVEKVLVCSPFVTNKGIESIENWLERDPKLKIQLLTNLDDPNLFLSFDDPTKPFRRLLERYGKERVRIRSLGNLHAKLFLIPENCALAGSSNLTGGGMEQNAEINFFLNGKNRKDDLEEVGKLQRWFETMWAKVPELNEEDLERYEKAWKEFEEDDSLREMLRSREQSLYQGEEIDFGRHGWSIIEGIMKKGNELSFQALKEALDIDQKPISDPYARARIRFLENLKLLEKKDGKDRWKPDKAMWEVYKNNPLTFLDLLNKRIYSLRPLLKAIRKTRKKRGISYAELEEHHFKKKDPKHHLPVGVCWLESMGYVDRLYGDQKGDRHHRFMITDEGKDLVGLFD